MQERERGRHTAKGCRSDSNSGRCYTGLALVRGAPTLPTELNAAPRLLTFERLS